MEHSDVCYQMQVTIIPAALYLPAPRHYLGRFLEYCIESSGMVEIQDLAQLEGESIILKYFRTLKLNWDNLAQVVQHM